MKRLATPLLAALAVLIADSAQAQTASFGVRGGVNIATASVKGGIFGDSGVGNRTGFHLGLLGSVNISSWFAVQTEFMYSQKGFTEGDGNVSVDLNYFEIPILWVVQLPEKKVSPHLYLGVVLGLEASCKVSTATEKNVNCEDVRDGPSLKGADSGIMFGGGVTIAEFGPGSLLVDLLFNYGLTNIAEITDDVDSIKTRTAYISAGYTFPIGGS
jgi:hypothetical protein